MGDFYLPENPEYTVFDSAADSVRFALLCLERCPHCGNLRARSSFVTPEGEPVTWHDFGTLEGPGWAANSVGGALELLQFASFTGTEEVRRRALSLLDHALNCGFVREDGLVVGYRETTTGNFCLNFKHNDEWLCPGSMARVGWQMLLAADLVDHERAERLREAALGCAGWVLRNVKRLESGWLPRRCRPDGSPYPLDAEGRRPDPIFDRSGDGAHVVLLLSELALRGLGDFRAELADLCKAFVGAGGLFGSVNHDTYDEAENVAYALAFRALLRASRALGDEGLLRFALDVCLAGLDQFKLTEDVNGVPTKGLLLMERSWTTAYMWENAEAATAYLEAFEAIGDKRFLTDALTILRAAAKHHHGPHGFLTEGVDFENCVGREHHIGGAEFGDIRYTEPLLNNLHIVEPTLLFLRKFAIREGTTFLDPEGNVVAEL